MPNLYAQESPLGTLKDKTVSLFTPIDLPISEVKDNTVTINTRSSLLKEGLRLNVFKKGETFYHPVTKEALGNFEKLSGLIEITNISGSAVTGKLLSGEANSGDIARVSKSKIKALFFQHKDVDWDLGDAYFRTLKESGRFELYDTSAITASADDLIAEAKKLNTDVLLYITSASKDKSSALIQDIYWTSDGKKFSSDSVNIDDNSLKEIGSRTSDFSLTSASDPLLTFKLTSGAKAIALGDLTGEGKQFIIVDANNKIKIYAFSVDLDELWEIENGKYFNEIIYLDTIDLNNNSKDEIVITSISSQNDVHSFIYEYNRGKLELLWKTEGFLRAYKKNSMLYQKFSKAEGYKDKIMTVKFSNNEYTIGDAVSLNVDSAKMPNNIGIYNFTEANMDNEPYILYYDDNNFLNLINKDGILVWRSEKDFGGFTKKFDKEALAIVSGPERKWFVGDRIISNKSNFYIIKRKALAGVTTSLGYKESNVIELFWNGFSLEEAILIDDINGGIADFYAYKGKIFVLTKPAFGINFKNIIKGENPLITYLFVYSVSN
ncbi:hypothetical protein MCHI_001421 [Candidatus Magnetoovum chiemensis]|nr:hypothetical protein MCHI_001421 [Candidatus Magnetoovum chiemensis]